MLSKKGEKYYIEEIKLILFIDFRKAFHYLNVYMDVYTQYCNVFVCLHLLRTLSCTVCSKYFKNMNK